MREETDHSSGNEFIISGAHTDIEEGIPLMVSKNIVCYEGNWKVLSDLLSQGLDCEEKKSKKSSA